MTSLGTLSLAQEGSVVAARSKIRRIAAEFGLSPMAATRLSTATSQAVRWARQQDVSCVLGLALDRIGSYDRLILSLSSPSTIPAPTFLTPFFDDVSGTGRTVTASTRLAGYTIDAAAIERARAIMSEQSRDELLAEVRSKNEALEASKEVLEQTVKERTAELAVTLDQLESSELIIERWMLDGTVTAMNAFGLGLLGFSEEEVLGRNAFETLVPRDEAVQATWIESGKRLAQDPSHYAESELQCQKKDGTPVWVAFRNKAILDADGEITEVLSVGLDVTERRALEAQLQAANERMEGELNIGRDIQMSMLPQHFPAFPDRDEFVVYATLEPAREVGGDLFDFFLIDEDRLCFLVGDVSDKGVPAALFMAVSKTAIKSQALSDSNTASIMTHVNDELAENNETSMFVTLFVAILDTRSGVMRYTNAGHNPPYVKKADGSVITLDDRHGPVAGALEGITFGSSELTLEPGDVAVLYSDGVTEAMDVDHVQFSDAALERLIADAPFDSTEASVAQINSAVARHRGDAEQSDDITVLALEYRGPDESAATLTLTVPATLESLAEVMEQFGEFAQEHGLDDTVRRQVLLVLDDLLNNIATYAYEGIEPAEGESQEIELDVELAPTRLVVTISDAGVPFNPFGMNAPDVQASLEERDIGGLGIHLVRTVMDEVDYNRRAGRNVVTVIKRLEPDSSDTGGDA